jgi:hypothetical protein
MIQRYWSKDFVGLRKCIWTLRYCRWSQQTSHSIHETERVAPRLGKLKKRGHRDGGIHIVPSLFKAFVLIIKPGHWPLQYNSWQGIRISHQFPCLSNRCNFPKREWLLHFVETQTILRTETAKLKSLHHSIPHHHINWQCNSFIQSEIVLKWYRWSNRDHRDGRCHLFTIVQSINPIHFVFSHSIVPILFARMPHFFSS